jgi:hypothetical protein
MINKEKLSKEEVIEKIISKKEFSQLPLADVELVYSKFDSEDLLVEEKIKLTREMLMKMYTVFVSEKLLNIKDNDSSWFLKKHSSTRERFGFEDSVYHRCLEGLGGRLNVYDLGCGVNGFSYDSFLGVGFEVKYFGFEAVGQLVDLQNNWFEKEKKDAECFHGSLFDLEGVKKLLTLGGGKRVVFLFKTLDSLEMLKRNYSKELLKEIVPLVDRVVVSWATKSLGAGKQIFANKKWLKEFIEENFKVIDEFEFGVEKYLVFGREGKHL